MNDSMFHMLSCFNLKTDETIDSFRAAFTAFVDEMITIDLVESSGPIGKRQSNTPMDTDAERSQEYFVIMSFRDRQQVDAAYAHIRQPIERGTESHHSVYSRVADPIFTCWQDLP